MTFDRALPPNEVRRIDWRTWGNLALLGIAWLWLNQTTLEWLVHLPQQVSTANLLIVLGGVLTCCIAGYLQREKLAGDVQFGIRRSPVILMLGSAILAIVLRWQLDLDSLQGACFTLGTYGLMGIILSPKRWRQGLPLISAITLGVAFSLSPLSRSFIAEIVERLLSPFQIHSLTSENILILDQGIAFIDLPCSGRKSFLTGSLFLMMATILERRQFGWRWLGLFITNLGLLFAANVIRILTLVVVTYVFQQAEIAAMIHVPLGLMSFVTICLVSWGLLRWIPQYPDKKMVRNRSAQTAPFSFKSIALLVSCLVGLSLIPSPAIATVSPDLFSTLPIQPSIELETVGLMPNERNFFANYPGVVAEKKSFTFNDVSGSMILVMSPSWEAHHAPELCLTGMGNRVSTMEKRALSDQITGRWLSLNAGQQNAAYWFQSKTRTTDSFLDRLWSEVTRQESQWTLVSILFNQSVDANTVQPLLNEVHDAIATRLS